MKRDLTFSKDKKGDVRDPKVLDDLTFIKIDSPEEVLWSPPKVVHAPRHRDPVSGRPG